MRFVVYVMAIFESDKSGAKQYDVWENTVIFNAEDPRKALEGGICRSKQLLNNASNLKIFGYPEKPVLYAVRSLDTDDSLMEGMTNCAHESMRLTKIATINESEFEAISSFECITIPYCAMYIDRS